MPPRSAGILLYRRRPAGVEVLLVHPGGPFWAKRDDGAWSLPKGLIEPGEEPVAAALREFEEELGAPPVTSSPAVHLGVVVQKGGKHVEAWAVEGDFDAAAISSSSFTIEWPPRSGRMRSFPEVDRADWFGLTAAGRKLLASQSPFLERLSRLLA
jgi:predicted NUDIX family NTP pyrophosphohydrolase